MGGHARGFGCAALRRVWVFALGARVAMPSSQCGCIALSRVDVMKAVRVLDGAAVARGTSLFARLDSGTGCACTRVVADRSRVACVELLPNDCMGAARLHVSLAGLLCGLASRVSAL